MTKLAIYLHAVAEPEFSTGEAITVDAVRREIGSAPDQLLMAHDVAKVLRRNGRLKWAKILDSEEEAHMVRVTFS